MADSPEGHLKVIGWVIAILWCYAQGWDEEPSQIHAGGQIQYKDVHLPV